MALSGEPGPASCSSPGLEALDGDTLQAVARLLPIRSRAALARTSRALRAAVSCPDLFACSDALLGLPPRLLNDAATSLTGEGRSEAWVLALFDSPNTHWLCRARGLERLAGGTSPVLPHTATRALEDPNPTVRATAVRCLAPHAADPATRSALSDLLLRDGEAMVRQAAAASFACLRGDEVPHRALAAALTDPDHRVREIAALQLDELGWAAKHASSLAHLLTDPVGSVRETSERLLVALGLAGQLPGTAVEAAVAALGDPEGRLFALPVIGSAGASFAPGAANEAMGEGVAAELAACLSDAVGDAVITAALAALCGMGPAAAAHAQEVAELLREEDFDLQMGSIQCLEAMGAAGARHVLALAVLARLPAEETYWEAVRAAATRAVRELACHAEVFWEPLVVELEEGRKLFDGRHNFRGATDALAAAAHGGHLPPPAVDAVVALLDNRREESNLAACRVLRALSERSGGGGKAGWPRGLSAALADHLDHPVPAVRAEVAMVLGRMGPEGAPHVSALSELLEDADLSVRGGGGEALRLLAAHAGPNAAEAAARRLGHAGEAHSHDVRCDAVLTLGAMGRFAAPHVAGMESLLEDGEPIVRLAATEALGALARAGVPGVAERAARSVAGRLEDSFWGLRRVALTELGAAPGLALPHLPEIAACTRNVDGRVARVAWGVLYAAVAMEGGAAAVAFAVADLLSSADPDKRGRAAEITVSCAARLPAEDPERTARVEAAAALLSDGDARVRMSAVSALCSLASLGGPAATPADAALAAAAAAPAFVAPAAGLAAADSDASVRTSAQSYLEDVARFSSGAVDWGLFAALLRSVHDDARRSGLALANILGRSRAAAGGAGGAGDGWAGAPLGPPLLGLMRGPDHEMARGALAALRAVGGRDEIWDVARAIAARAADGGGGPGGPQHRADLVDACMEIGARMAPEDVGARAGAGAPPHERAAALAALAGMGAGGAGRPGSEGWAAQASAALRDEDPGVRLAATRFFCPSGYSDLVPGLPEGADLELGRAARGDLDAGVRMRALEALGEWVVGGGGGAGGAEAAVAVALGAWEGDESPRVMTAAQDALSRMGAAVGEHVRATSRHLADAEAALGAAADEVLGALAVSGHQSHVDELVALLGHPSTVVRESALRALGAAPAPAPLVPHARAITGLLGDPDPRVRIAAARLLPALASALRTTEREAPARGAGEGGAAPLQRRLVELAQGLLADPVPEVRRAGAEALAGVGDRVAVAARRLERERRDLEAAARALLVGRGGEGGGVDGRAEKLLGEVLSKLGVA